MSFAEKNDREKTSLLKRQDSPVQPLPAPLLPPPTSLIDLRRSIRLSPLCKRQIKRTERSHTRKHNANLCRVNPSRNNDASQQIIYYSFFFFFFITFVTVFVHAVDTRLPLSWNWKTELRWFHFFNK